MSAHRCPDCNKFKRVEYADDYSQIELELDDDVLASAEYEFTLSCEDCGTEMLTGLIVFECYETTPGVQAFIDELVESVRDDARDKYLDEHGLRMVWHGGNLNFDEEKALEEARDEAEAAIEHEFEIEEQGVEVYMDREHKRILWVMEIHVKITDAKHPEWEGEELTLKDSIYQDDLEECF